MNMTIVRASHMGMCFGVRDAIAFATAAAETGPLTILGELVHNEVVLEALRARGIRLETDLERVDTAAVMVTAHGASKRRLADAGARGLKVLDATCPLVGRVRQAISGLVRNGFHPVVIGKRDHAEVRGLTEDLDEFDVVLDAADVLLMEPRERFGVVAQTTQPVGRVRHLASLIGLRFPRAEVRLVDTVCGPTKRHQVAAAELARRCDVVVVIGGTASNNTQELVATCGEHCGRVQHVQGPDDLRAKWFDGVAVAGITAGTSTPDSLIDAVEARMRRLTGRQAAA